MVPQLLVVLHFQLRSVSIPQAKKAAILTYIHKYLTFYCNKKENEDFEMQAKFLVG